MRRLYLLWGRLMEKMVVDPASAWRVSVMLPRMKQVLFVPSQKMSPSEIAVRARIAARRAAEARQAGRSSPLEDAPSQSQEVPVEGRP